MSLRSKEVLRLNFEILSSKLKKDFNYDIVYGFEQP